MKTAAAAEPSNRMKAFIDYVVCRPVKSVELRVDTFSLVTCRRSFFTAHMIPPDLLLHAYRNAVFPMAMDDGEIAWFSPDPRAIIPLDSFHVPHGLRRSLRKNTFEVRIDTAFKEVMAACAERDETWINEEILASYVRLHQLGHAHS